MATIEDRRANYTKHKKVLEIVKGMLKGVDEQKTKMLKAASSDEARAEIERKFAREHEQCEENCKNVEGELKFFECELRIALEGEIKRKEESLKRWRERLSDTKLSPAQSAGFREIAHQVHFDVNLLRREIADLSL